MIVSKLKELTLITYVLTNAMFCVLGVMVTFASTSYTISESDEFVVVMVIMVGNNSEVDVPVVFNTIDNTAIGATSEEKLFAWHYYLGHVKKFPALSDYIGVSELVLTFGPSASYQMVRLNITDDQALELTESFTAVLSAPDGEARVSFIEDQAMVHILDNDGKCAVEHM